MSLIYKETQSDLEKTMQDFYGLELKLVVHSPFYDPESMKLTKILNYYKIPYKKVR